MTVAKIGSTDAYTGLNAEGRPTDIPAVVAITAGSDGAPVSALPPGRAGAVASVPVVLSNEDFAALSDRASQAPTTKVDSTTTSGQLVAANANRKNLIIVNTDANALYLLYAGSGTVSVTNLSDIVPSNGRIEVNGYTGAVQGVWAGDGAGSAFITQFAV